MNNAVVNEINEGPYVVIYVSDLVKSYDFYRDLGFDLKTERHGSGPIHYSISCDGIVIEIYQGKCDVISKIRLGMPKKLLNSTAKIGLFVDPDGNKVHIY